MTVSDGTDTSTDSVNVDVHVTTAATPLLFIASLPNVVAYDISKSDNLNGNIAPSANLSGGQTQITVPIDVVIDNRGALLVTNRSATPNITTYLNAVDLSGINGNVAPTGNVQGTATTLKAPFSLAFVVASDLLFISDQTPARILVFGSVSNTAFNGNLAPIRTFTSTDMTNPCGISFGAGDTLYVANGTGKTVAVFDNASTLNAPVAATRVIASASFGNLQDVFVDTANDRMFVADITNKQIHMFSNASTRNGTVMPDVILTIPVANTIPESIVVDSKGIGYIADEANNAIYSYDSIFTRNGSIAPDRTLKGTNTLIVQPSGLFLRE